MSFKKLWNWINLWIRIHFLVIFGFIIGLIGGIFTAFIGLLIGILLEPILQQFLLERSITSYLIQADPRFKKELKPGITAFCALAVYCIIPEPTQGTELSQKAIVEKALNLFHGTLSDWPHIEMLCRLARDNQDLLNVDLLAESLKARLKEDVNPEQALFTLQELVTKYSSGKWERLHRITQVIAPETEKINKDSPWYILGVAPGASVKEIKKSFRRLALQYHPDRLSLLSEAEQQAAEEQFITIRQAYKKVLSENREPSFKHNL
ncbi:J domain-containing protein [Gracilinema caldarium]|uniref:Heat shock protein DnaJ domain protein n=1 Tax=Gracilinema caldarium (strain ATCC 51460 / DSM 7334 / H1) TaxID=744872 RepID=F8EYG2_GRAC1|nr:J domain-containing protein [Gracilinema caldarium]AEJ18394.1 heat shock protein DnaJ domain protein [Gracilinema caldarium DSM 7334]